MESYEQMEKNDLIRMDIIREITGIHSTEELERIRSFTYTCEGDFRDRPMQIDELANEIDHDDAVRILSVLAECDEVKRGVAKAYVQLYEAFSDSVSEGE